jgi:integrase
MPKITKTTIDNLKPQLLEQWVWDSEVQGFGVRCTPTGRKVYVVRYRNAAGQQRKMNLGRCSDMPPEKARQRAREAFTQISEGKDPAADKKAATAPVCSDNTLGLMFEAYVADMRRKGRASADEVERVLLKAKNNVADALGPHRQAGSVEPHEIVHVLSPMFSAGRRGAADKTRSYVASAYTWAIQSANDYTVANRQVWGITRNPAVEIPRDGGATTARDRNLSIAELRMLWQDTRPGSAGFAPETAACIRVLIGCGQRVQETLRLEAHEIDQAGLWRMPAEKTKGRKHAHELPLPKQVLGDLQTLRQIHPSGHLFVGRDGGPMDHRSIMQALERWYIRREVAPFQTRDLRRTWKSRAHDAGVDRFTRDLIQQHAKSDTGSKNYDRANYLPQVREAMAKWSAWIDTHLEDKPALQLVA